MGDGWYACALETVARAEPFPNVEVRIARELRGSGFILTVLDLDEERGESSSHATVEEAKAEAARRLQHSLHWK